MSTENNSPAAIFSGHWQTLPRIKWPSHTTHFHYKMKNYYTYLKSVIRLTPHSVITSREDGGKFGQFESD